MFLLTIVFIVVSWTILGSFLGAGGIVGATLASNAVEETQRDKAKKKLIDEIGQTQYNGLVRFLNMYDEYHNIVYKEYKDTYYIYVVGRNETAKENIEAKLDRLGVKRYKVII